MTEGHESDFLVTVRAQVMSRDESTGGWVPLAGGGLANVSIRKRARLSPGAAGHEYIMYGQRISDQSVILSCAINRDLKYHKVMPTFHHWRAGKQRNGLTFQTAADARAFDKGIIRAFNELIYGMAKSNPSIIWPPLTKYDSVGEDDVFMTLDLPVETETMQKTHSSPEGSEKSHKSLSDPGERHKDTCSNKSDSEKNDKPTIHYISSEKSLCMQQPPPAPPPPVTSTSAEPPPTIAQNYSYVTLTAVHDYNYPVVDQPVSAAQVFSTRRESISAVKKRNALEAAQVLAAQSSPISAAILKDHHAADVDIIKKNQRIRCRFCQELYNDEWNRRGDCEFAPDKCHNCIHLTSCMCIASGCIYHCCSDSEGETPRHPCQCSEEPSCTKRWFCLTLLSLMLPCLLCYLPLRACHRMGICCGLCGAKHEPQV